MDELLFSNPKGPGRRQRGRCTSVSRDVEWAKERGVPSRVVGPDGASRVSGEGDSPSCRRNWAGMLHDQVSPSRVMDAYSEHSRLLLCPIPSPFIGRGVIGLGASQNHRIRRPVHAVLYTEFGPKQVRSAVVLP